jgi:hypothetical protein
MKTKELQHIGDMILKDYLAGTYVRLSDGRIEFWCGNLKIRCKHRPDAVRAVANKYKKGLPYGGKTGPSTVRPRRVRKGPSVSGWVYLPENATE